MVGKRLRSNKKIMEMKNIISQIKWNSYASAECPTKNGRYLVIMPQFTYSDNISLDINVLTYCVPMDDWCYLWGSSVEENKLPLYWAEIDTSDIVDRFNRLNKKESNNINEDIVDIDAELYVKYMPKSLSVNNHCNIKDIIKIWNSEMNLKKYSDLYKYWQDQAVKYLSPIPSNPSLWLFFIECYKAAKEGRDGFFIERVCYSTNIMWRNDFKSKRLIMSWHSGDEANIDKLLAEVERIEKDKKEFEKGKENEYEELKAYLQELTQLPKGFELYFNNLKDVNRIWDNEKDVTCLLSDSIQNELKELEFKFVYADYHDMMRAIEKVQVDKINKKKWQFWQSCLKMAKKEKGNFTLWYIPENFKVTDKNRSLLLTKQVWAIFWGGYKLMSWDCQFNENGELIIPELAYEVIIEEKNG